ncbi:MAG: DUF4307 domain-containing protein [Propionibacteriaceae bacterium]|nr:DUF4307 domain-containing protein [Propionibacteriaceae bacterium]
MRTPEDQARIAARYPQRRGSSGIIIAVGAVVTVAGLAWLAWTSLFHANPPIVGAVNWFSITSDDFSDAVLTVQRNSAEVTGVCTVIAQAVTFERVGEIEVNIPAGKELLSDHKIRLKTLKRATSVSVTGCRPV